MLLERFPAKWLPVRVKKTRQIRSLALNPLLLAVHGRFNAARGVRIFPRHLTKGSAGGLLLLQRRQRLSQPQQGVRRFRRFVEFGGYREKGFGGVAITLPLEKILRALPVIARHRRPSARSFAELSLAICTTDTRPKTASCSFKMAGKRIHFVGCAKGAGMIHPNMATMLAFVITDAAIASALLQKTLREVTSRTFNAISIDGDTSTNDTLLVLANGAAGAHSIKSGSAAHRAFTHALEEVCRSLALQIVADGEGAQRVIEIEVRGAKSESAARRIAETIATSPLVKTAFAGGDPNWGRIFAAAGRSGVKFDPSLVEITMAGVPVLRRGRPLDFNERDASNRLLAKHVPIIVNMHAGDAIARYWTCDFTAEYVRINASYRT